MFASFTVGFPHVREGREEGGEHLEDEIKRRQLSKSTLK